MNYYWSKKYVSDNNIVIIASTNEDSIESRKSQAVPLHIKLCSMANTKIIMCHTEYYLAQHILAD